MTSSGRPTPEQVSAVVEWLERAFEQAHVASEGNFDREVQLFRVHGEGPSAPKYELEVSYEAFEDNEAPSIVKALDQQGAAERLRKERRLFLNRALALTRSSYGQHGEPVRLVSEYNVLEFPSFEQAHIFMSRMMGFVGSPQGIQWMLDTPHRVVIWQPFRLPPGPNFRKDASTFYVSIGVLHLARALGVDLPQSRIKLKHEELPSERALLIGVQSDWS